MVAALFSRNTAGEDSPEVPQQRLTPYFAVLCSRWRRSSCQPLGLE